MDDQPRYYAVPLPESVRCFSGACQDRAGYLVGRYLPVELLGTRYVRCVDPDTGARWLYARHAVRLHLNQQHNED
jgi:hypothetical protein